MPFYFRLGDGVLTVYLEEDLATADEAKKLVEPFLRTWEVDAELRGQRGEFTFGFKDALVVDLDPRTGIHHVSASAHLSVDAGGRPSVVLSRASYPAPPSGFRITPDVETLWSRYQGCLNRQEPLQTMAYMCLTVLGASAGGRNKAAAMYRISGRVLSKIGTLTGPNRGDPATVRKMTQGPLQPLTDQERGWLVAAVKLLIRRVGEHGVVRNLPQLTMADLPPL